MFIIKLQGNCVEQLFRGVLGRATARVHCVVPQEAVSMSTCLKTKDLGELDIDFYT